MADRAGAVMFKGNPITLGGPEIKAGSDAPDFTAVDNGLQPVKLSQAKGKVIVLSAVPSLDTPVCDTETRRFNQEAGKLGGRIAGRGRPLEVDSPCGKSAGANRPQRSDDRAAAVTGYDAKSISMARFVVSRAVAEPDTFQSIREEMNRSRNINKAHAAVRRIEREARYVFTGGSTVVEAEVTAHPLDAKGTPRPRVQTAQTLVLAYRDRPEYAEGRARWSAYQRDVLKARLDHQTGRRETIVVDDRPRPSFAEEVFDLFNPLDPGSPLPQIRNRNARPSLGPYCGELP